MWPWGKRKTKKVQNSSPNNNKKTKKVQHSSSNNNKKTKKNTNRRIKYKPQSPSRKMPKRLNKSKKTNFPEIPSEEEEEKEDEYLPTSIHTPTSKETHINSPDESSDSGEERWDADDYKKSYVHEPLPEPQSTTIQITRHSISCNQHSSGKITKLGKDFEPGLTDSGIIKTLEFSFNSSIAPRFTLDKNINNDYVVYVSPLYRTWCTAVLLYGIHTNNEPLTLIIAPYLKEFHGYSRRGNYPKALKHMVQKFNAFLNHLSSSIFSNHRYSTIKDFFRKLPETITIKVGPTDCIDTKMIYKKVNDKYIFDQRLSIPIPDEKHDSILTCDKVNTPYFLKNGDINKFIEWTKSENINDETIHVVAHSNLMNNFIDGKSKEKKYFTTQEAEKFKKIIKKETNSGTIQIVTNSDDRKDIQNITVYPGHNNLNFPKRDFPKLTNALCGHSGSNKTISAKFSDIKPGYVIEINDFFYKVHKITSGSTVNLKQIVYLDLINSLNPFIKKLLDDQKHTIPKDNQISNNEHISNDYLITVNSKIDSIKIILENLKKYMDETASEKISYKEFIRFIHSDNIDENTDEIDERLKLINDPHLQIYNKFSGKTHTGVNPHTNKNSSPQNKKRKVAELLGEDELDGKYLVIKDVYIQNNEFSINVNETSKMIDNQFLKLENYMPGTTRQYHKYDSLKEDVLINYNDPFIIYPISHAFKHMINEEYTKFKLKIDSFEKYNFFDADDVMSDIKKKDYIQITKELMNMIDLVRYVHKNGIPMWEDKLKRGGNKRVTRRSIHKKKRKVTRRYKH